MHLTRQQLAGMPLRPLHAGRNVTKASISLVEIRGRPVVVKDLAGRPAPVRWWLGPWQLDRECRAYRRLEGLPGVPRLLSRLDRQAIALEYIDGPALAILRRGDLQGAFFDQLERLVRAMHARGVAHGDLHRHDVLQGPDGAPRLVDFSTSLISGRGLLRRLLYRQMCRADLRAVAKLRNRFLGPGAPPAPERPGLYRAGHLLGRLLRSCRRREPRARRRLPPGSSVAGGDH